MRVTLTRAGTTPAAAMADPVVDRDPALPSRSVGAGTGLDGDRVVPPAAAHRTRVAALSARVDRLERELAAAERRRQATVDRYEAILERRTETFRRWVRGGDPRPGEFQWIGRETPARDPAAGPDPTASAGTAVATDGGRARSEGGGSTVLGRFVDRLRSLVG